MKQGFARHVVVALAAAGTMGLMSATANAQSVRFAGTTTGCFFSGTATSCTGASTSTVNSLVFKGSTFDASSNAADGLFTLGSTATAPNFNNLGSFTLTDGTSNYTGQKFSLFLNFTTPTGVRGDSMYRAVLTGNLSQSTSGNVFINFVDAAHKFTFSNGSTLSFRVNDLSIDDQNTAGNTATVAITGQGFATGSTVPEPSSMALLGTGLVGLVPMFRRRKNKA